MVFTRWGRTGTSGSCKLETFQDVDKAVAQFAKMFLAKTGFDWDEHENYVAQCAHSSHEILAVHLVMLLTLEAVTQHLRCL